MTYLLYNVYETMKKLRLMIGLSAGALLMIGFAVIVYYGRPVMKLEASSTDNQFDSLSTASDRVESPSNSSESYTLSQIAEHGNQESCWAAVNDQVYDLTTWVSRHPGGAVAILELCGTDATARFERQHGHNKTANKTLALLKIGSLSL